jgi:hypothetical protein
LTLRAILDELIKLDFKRMLPTLSFVNAMSPLGHSADIGCAPDVGFAPDAAGP